jgi:hypothetical protein
MPLRVRMLPCESRRERPAIRRLLDFHTFRAEKDPIGVLAVYCLVPSVYHKSMDVPRGTVWNGGNTRNMRWDTGGMSMEPCGDSRIYRYSHNHLRTAAPPRQA